MKVMVAYVSWTGNTKKVAEAIFSAIEAEKDIKQFRDIVSLEGYDLIFAGFPIHGFGQPAAEARSFLEKYCEGKKTAIFITHAAPEGFALINEWLKDCKALARKTKFQGIFDCQGRISDDQLEMMRKSPDNRAREIAKKIALSSSGKPDESCLKNAGIFANKILEKAK